MIDAIVSDHRPQDQDSKRVPFAQAEPGGIGLETLLPISLELVHNGHLTLPRLFQLLSSTPARLFGLPGGKLAKGAPADLVVFDADYAWKVDRDELWSKTKNTPFDERPVQGRVMATIVGGRTIYRRRQFRDDCAGAPEGGVTAAQKLPPNGHFVCYGRGVPRIRALMMLRQSLLLGAARLAFAGAGAGPARAASRATTCSTP